MPSNEELDVMVALAAQPPPVNTNDLMEARGPGSGWRTRMARGGYGARSSRTEVGMMDLELAGGGG